MKRTWRLLALSLTILLMLSVLTGCGAEKKTDLRIGGKNFNEQFIMAEMLKILIEENTDINTSVQTNLGASVIYDAIKSNQIDLYVEYTGSGLTNLGLEVITDPKQVYDTVKSEFDKQFNIKWLEPLGFNNTYAMVVTKETAEKYNLKTISDLAKVANELTLGCTYVFTERGDGYPGLSKHYGFEFKDVKGMDASLMYQAVEQGSVDVISGFTTDGRIASLGLVILEDDKRFFPPYDAAVIVRGEVLEKYPELEEVLNRLAGRISEPKMAKLNALLDLEKREPADVAREFLKEEGLIGK